MNKIILDNSTIFAATEALRWSSDFAHSIPNLFELSKLLDSLILHDKILVCQMPWEIYEHFLPLREFKETVEVVGVNQIEYSPIQKQKIENSIVEHIESIFNCLLEFSRSMYTFEPPLYRANYDLWSKHTDFSAEREMTEVIRDRIDKLAKKLSRKCKKDLYYGENIRTISRVLCLGCAESVILPIVRSYNYLKLSSSLDIPYKPHFFRIAIVKVIPTFECNKTFRNTFDIYRTFEKNLFDYIKKDLEGERLELLFPLTFSLVLKESNSPSDIFKVCSEIRNSKEARSFRKILSSVEPELNVFNYKNFRALKRLLEDQTDNIVKKLGGTPIQKMNIAYKFPFSIDFSIKTSDLVQMIRDRRMRKSLNYLEDTSMRALSFLTLQKDIERIWKVKLDECDKWQIKSYADSLKRYDNIV